MAIDWNEIRIQHAARVWSIAWRILRNEADALDCSQEVMIEAFTRSQSKPVEDWNRFLSWLTTRRAIDFLRKRKREQKILVQHPAELIEQATTRHRSMGADNICSASTNISAQALEFDELVSEVRNLLAELPDRQAEAFWMCVIEQMSYRDVAEATGESTNRIGVWVHRAREFLKKRLQEFDPELKRFNRPNTKSATTRSISETYPTDNE